mmetsp:Transcript_4220/g.15712  ORF Transcript_4220/g.15712 Transcript_4220/m.15712 type:complete len:329 (+) Transcript_4220:154-1140(+)
MTTSLDDPPTMTTSSISSGSTFPALRSASRTGAMARSTNAAHDVARSSRVSHRVVHASPDGSSSFESSSFESSESSSRGSSRRCANETVRPPALSFSSPSRAYTSSSYAYTSSSPHALTPTRSCSDSALFACSMTRSAVSSQRPPSSSGARKPSSRNSRQSHPTSARSKSSPPKCGSPDVPNTKNVLLLRSSLSTATSNVPPPRSYTITVRSTSSSCKPYAIAAATGSSSSRAVANPALLAALSVAARCALVNPTGTDTVSDPNANPRLRRKNGSDRSECRLRCDRILAPTSSGGMITRLARSLGISRLYGSALPCIVAPIAASLGLG